MKEKYEKEVSTVAMHKQKMRLSLEEPNSPVKISIDAHSSQSISSAKTISGIKVTTATIAFKVDFKENHFENELYSWILSCIESRQAESRDTSKTLHVHQDMAHNKLAATTCTTCTLLQKLQEIGKDHTKNRELVNDCIKFVATLGVTHYISAIKLGAMLYRVVSANTKQTTVGAGAEVGGGRMAGGGVMSRSKQLFKKFEAEQEIGRIGTRKDGHVENVAVIGCQIQPVYKLVTIPVIQRKLQEAIKEYIQLKEEKSGKVDQI